MDLTTFYKNFETRDIPFFKLFVLLLSLFVVNYICITTAGQGSSSLVAFMFFEVVLIIVDPLYAFVFCFVLGVDVMSCISGTNWGKAFPLLGMYSVFIFDIKSLFALFVDKKLKRLFILSLIFVLFLILINIGAKSGLNSLNISQSFKYIFGFLVIVPAYYFTLKRPKELFVSLSIVAATVLLVFYLDLAKGYGIFKLDASARSTEAVVDRLAGYDIRQFMLFFTYLIPAAMLVTHIKPIYKYFLMGVGLMAYAVLIIAMYRLAMFYTVMGMLISYFFIRKYADTRNIFKYLFVFFIIFLLAGIFFGDYLNEIQKLFENTINYFAGKANAEDTSADARFEFQFPILSDLIFTNFWTGVGLVEIRALQAFGMYGFVDFPIIGTLAAFGVIGMSIYYLKFLLLLSDTSTNFSSTIVNNNDPFVLYIYMTLKAYFITMITFRLFYISWELTFDYQQIEFGLFAGVFLALHNILRRSEYETRGEDETEQEQENEIGLLSVAR